jgi:PAS domain S-box-containing protein
MPFLLSTAAYSWNPYALFALSCAVVTLASGVAIAVHERYSRVGRLYLLMTGSIGLWLTSLGLAMLAANPAAGYFWAKGSTLFSALMVPMIFQFAVFLADAWRAWSRYVWLVWAAGASLVAVLLFGSGFVDSAYHYAWGYCPRYGPVGYVFIAYTMAVVGACQMLFVRLVRQHPKTSFAYRRGRLVLAALVVGGAAAVDFLPPLGFDVFPVGGGLLAAANVLNAYAAWRLRLVEITPGFAAQQFMDTMSDGVLVLDRDGMVRLVNAAVSEMLGIGAEGLLNRAPQAGVRELFLGEESGESFPQAGFVGQERQYRTPGGKRRVLSVSVSLMREGGQEPVAAVVTLRDITAATVAQEQIHRLAYYDALTGLPNRMLLKERFGQAMARAERARGMAAVLFLDLDRFKQVNDTLGHDAGDVLLKAVAERIVGCVRESDVVLRHGQAGREAVRGRDGGATLARLGGDEFVLLLSPIERSEDAAKVARRILQSLVAPFRLTGGAEVLTGVSIRISVYPHDGEDAETLLKKADLAMYHAKETGRNHFRFFDEALNVSTMERFGLETSLRRAMTAQEFLLRYQPVVTGPGRRVVGLDVQLYWEHPQRGLIHECEFMQAAHDAGLAVPLCDWVVRTACFQLRAWDGAGVPPQRLFVTVNPTMLERGHLLETVRESLAQTRIRPQQLVLYLHEPGARADRERVASVLEALRRLDVGLALDDFGSGSVSIADLVKHPASMVRLRGALLGRTGRGHESGVLARALVALIHGFGMQAYASGADDDAHAALLREAGCDYLSGKAYGAPHPAEEIPALLSALGPQPAA